MTRHWSDALPRRDDLTAFVEAVDVDPAVAGVVLTGHWALGLGNGRADVGLIVVLDEASDTWSPTSPLMRALARAGTADVTVRRLADLGRVPADPGRWWDRYLMARVVVLLDRADGRVAEAMRPWASLSPAETADAIDFYLDPYLTYAVRTLKDRRNGDDVAAHLNAVEGLPWTVRLLFAVHSRVRPINAYLEWELTTHPFEDPEWATDHILGLLRGILDDGDPSAVREVFRLLEPALCRHGFGGALDGWGDQLAILRGR